MEWRMKLQKSGVPEKMKKKNPRKIRIDHSIKLLAYHPLYSGKMQGALMSFGS